jgi:hypothetical protein
VRGHIVPGPQAEALAEPAGPRAHGRGAAVGTSAGRDMV